MIDAPRYASPPRAPSTRSASTSAGGQRSLPLARSASAACLSALPPLPPRIPSQPASCTRLHDVLRNAAPLAGRDAQAVVTLLWPLHNSEPAQQSLRYQQLLGDAFGDLSCQHALRRPEVAVRYDCHALQPHVWWPSWRYCCQALRCYVRAMTLYGHPTLNADLHGQSASSVLQGFTSTHLAAFRHKMQAGRMAAALVGAQLQEAGQLFAAPLAGRADSFNHAARQRGQEPLEAWNLWLLDASQKLEVIWSDDPGLSGDDVGP